VEDSTRRRLMNHRFALGPGAPHRWRWETAMVARAQASSITSPSWARSSGHLQGQALPHEGGQGQGPQVASDLLSVSRREELCPSNGKLLYKHQLISGRESSTAEGGTALRGYILPCVCTASEAGCIGERDRNVRTL